MTGFTSGMADLLRCCDLAVTKAGPGTIAEAACCGTPMLLTSHLPGQETGQHRIRHRAAGAGAGPGVRQLCTEIGGPAGDRDALAAMAAASARMGQPGAAADIARRIAGLVSMHTHPRPGHRGGRAVRRPGPAAGILPAEVWWAP